MRKLPKLYDDKDARQKNAENVRMKRALKSIITGFSLIILYALLAMDSTHNVRDYVMLFAFPSAILLTYGFAVFFAYVCKWIWDGLTS